MDPDGDLEHRLALIAHELRTPLAVSLSAAETVASLLQQDDPDVAHVAELATILQRQTRLATKLLDRLRLVHDVREESVELAIRRLDMVRIVKEIIDDVGAHVLQRRTITMAEDGPLLSDFDPSAVAEIVFNLLDNAAKYSPTTATIDVSVGGSGALALIIVRDHGPGLGEAAEAEAMFGAYAQGSRSSQGVGLGLYVSRGLARAHGGDLTARPATGGGSEFVLELPQRAVA